MTSVKSVLSPLPLRERPVISLSRALRKLDNRVRGKKAYAGCVLSQNDTQSFCSAESLTRLSNTRGPPIALKVALSLKGRGAKEVIVSLFQGVEVYRLSIHEYWRLNE